MILVSSALVYKCILCIELQVLRKEVVQTDLVHGLGTIPFLVVAIGLVTGLSVELALYYRHDAESIPTVGLVA